MAHDLSMKVSFDANSQCYFAVNASVNDAVQLTKLLWRPHPDAHGVWWTRSPYLAAPYWPCVAADDVATRNALGWFAWNYQTSFAREPLTGTGVDSIRIPAGEKPFPFQVAGVQRAVRQQRILIADQPGLGKSLSSLVTANITRPERIVIGCPTMLVHNWAAECEKWLVDPRTISILDNPRKPVPDRGVIIVPYSRGHTFAEKLLRGPKIDHLILDEVHQLKNPTARRTAPWLSQSGVATSASRVVALTGTPVMNNPLEIHSLLQVIAPDTVGQISRDKFKELYCSTFKGTAKVARKGGGEASVEFESNSGKNEDVLNAELRASGVMIRRLKDDVLDQLPPKHVYLMHLTPTAAIEDLVREEATLYEMLETKIMTSQELIALQGHIMNVRQRLGVLKAPKIAEYLMSIFEAGEDRVVCFMLHLEPIDIIRKCFEHTRIKVRLMTGGQNPSVRQANVNAFQRPGGLELFLGQFIAAGVGLTATAARYCVVGELPWTPAIADQGIDRVHRISQQRQVEAPIIAFPHSVEERVIRANAKKAISAYNILDVNLMKLATDMQLVA